MKTVLVVDDEFGIPDALSDILSDEGFRVLIARNGKDGLRRVEEQRPDLIVLDYMMPVMDGYQMLRELRSRPGMDDLPVIMTSALNRQSLPPDCNPTAYLRKPFELSSLLEMIVQLLP